MKSLILPPLSALYGAVTRTRIALYERGTFRTAKLPGPVISIGNITTGGTGKTPLVEWVARVLAGSGKRVCILTRGYGRRDPKQRVVVSDGETIFADPAEAGDEPFLLANNLLGVAAVISDANRVAAGQGAIKHLATDCFVLDDGFQHFQLARDLNIVTIDATNPWGGRQLLPFGRLREPLTGLKRADCIVLTRCEQVSDTQPIVKELVMLSGDRPVFHSRMQTSKITPIDNSGNEFSSTTAVAAFCGVGNPQSFFSQVLRNGLEPVLQMSFADHYIYSAADVEKIVASAKEAGASSLITTAKDAVKLRRFNFDIPCYCLEIEIEIEEKDELSRLISAVGER